MRVGLNATCFDERPSGAKQRFVGLYGALARMRPDIEFLVYEPVDCGAAGWLGALPNVRARPTNVRTGGSLWRALTGFGRWSALLARDRLDLFETFNMPMIEAPACPTILTIHDARHIHDTVGWLRQTVNAAIWRRAMTRAAMVVTVSQAMRDEIAAFHTGTPIMPIYNGIDLAQFGTSSPPAQVEVRTRYDLPDRFALAVGHLEPRKNYPRLIEAIAMLRGRGRPLSLVIVGNDGGDRNAIAELIAAHDLGGIVKLLSDVSDAHLRALYAASELVVFPSLYEGFGIPLIETMASRRPIVTSAIPVFREITEDRGVYFDPTSVEAMAEAIDRVAGDPSLAGQLVAYGDQRLGDFGYDRLAGQMSTLYAEYLGAPQRG